MTARGGGSGEADFLDRIDCQFPYFDREGALALAEEALSISANAAFAVVYEVCYVPKDVVADLEIRREVLARIGRGLAHPLKGTILRLAQEVIDGRRLESAEQIERMREVAPHRGQYAALLIAYSAGEDDPSDDERDRVHAEIVKAWG